jgi:hypothetical protein
MWRKKLNFKQTKLPLPTYSFPGLGVHKIKLNMADRAKMVSFYDYSKGWILHGNEFG